MTQEIIGASEYTALGTLQRMPYGNGLAQSHALDASGRLEAKAVRNQQATALSRTSYRYNGDNEILSISDDVTANLSQTLGYDGLGRLSTLARSGVTYTLSHDAGGNYTALDATTEATRYAIDAKSNRMLSFSNQDGTRTYQFDALGNRISETSGSRISTFTYGPFNRMVQSNVGGLRTDYLLNAQGQRVGKSGASSASRYFYAGQNQLLSEQTGTTWTNYLWFGGELVGIDRNGAVSFVHNDHLGRPEYATNKAQQVVWKAYNYAYGRSVLKDDIGGLNIGFPGQYYDGESGLWYNGFRDYDASAGRYVQSDPIGLAGGMNTYAYAENNPISSTDQLGLESSGSFNNGGHRQKWEDGTNVRPVDYIKVQVSLYVFGVSRTFSRSGRMFRAGGIARSYPKLSGKLQASVSIGWLNQCDEPTRSKVDDHIGGYGMSGAAGYRGVGGGLNYSPGSGTSTEIGIGIGGGASPGEISEQDGSWGGGW